MNATPLFTLRNGFRVPLTPRGLFPAFHCTCCGFVRCAAAFPLEAAELSARLGRTGVQA